MQTRQLFPVRSSSLAPSQKKIMLQVCTLADKGLLVSYKYPPEFAEFFFFCLSGIPVLTLYYLWLFKVSVMVSTLAPLTYCSCWSSVNRLPRISFAWICAPNDVYKKIYILFYIYYIYIVTLGFFYFFFFEWKKIFYNQDITLIVKLAYSVFFYANVYYLFYRKYTNEFNIWQNIYELLSVAVLTSQI